MKTNHQTINDEVFKPLSTVSPEEILASGGATAYGIKTGSENLKKRLQNLPDPKPFTVKE